jgi:hypothetical protein
MSKHDRKEVARSLKEQIKLTTDPEQLIKLTREYNRLTNPRYGGKRVVKEAKPSGIETTSPIVVRWADRLKHVQPEAKRIEVIWQLEVEKRYKGRGIVIQTTEGRALLIGVMKEVMGELSAREQALLETLNNVSPEVA